MGEDEVRIPIRIAVDKQDLTELKADIQRTFDDVQRYEKSFSTRKQPFKLVDVNETKAEIDRVTAEIAKLQSQFTATAKSTPMSRWKDIFHQISDEIKVSKNEYKELLSEQGRLGANSRAHKKDLEEIASIEERILESTEKYADAKSKIDTSKRGSKTELKNLENQYKQEQRALKDSLATAKTKEAASRASVEQSKIEVASLRSARSEHENTIAKLRVQAKQIGTLAKSESYVHQEEQRRIDALREINAELLKQQEYLEGLQNQMEHQFYADQKRTGQESGSISKHDKAIAAQEEKARREELEQAKIRERVLREEQQIRRALAAEAIKLQDKQTAQLIASKNKEISAIKQSAAQYYYKLRAIKMLGFAVNNVTSVLNKFGKTSVNVATKALKAYTKLLPGVSLLQKRLSKAATSQKKFATETKKLNGSSKQFNFTLKDLIKNVLKYGIGIRSLFVLFNKLRSAMMFGFENMAKQFDSVNTALSSLLTSFTMMKNAIATAVQPLTNVLAPILEKLSALFADLTYKVASFIAALTGKSTVFKAVRVQQDYAESLDKTAKNAKKAKQELSGLDKLNVINSDKDNGDDSAGNFFEEVPIDSTMADWAKKFKDFLNRLLAPIKAAWEKMKSYVLGSWEFMCDKLKSLWGAVAETFWRVWEEEATQKIFENIFRIVGDIMRIVGTLAGKIEEAWRANDNGYRILSSLRDIIGDIVQHVADATYATLLWAQQLDLVPLFTAIADVLQNQIVPAVDNVLDLLLYLYKEVVLPLAKYVIENILPVLTRAFGNIAETIGNIAENIQKALEKGDTGKKIVEKVESIAQKVADAFERITEKTRDWSKDLNFENFFNSVDNFLEKIQPAIDFVISTVEKFWTDVILPFWKYLVEDGGPKLLDLLSQIFGQYDENTGLGVDWEHLTTVMNEFMDALEPFLEKSWETLLKIIEDLGAKFDEFVNSGTLDTIVDKFSEWVENADPEELAHKIETFAVVLVELIAAFNLISQVIVPIITNFMTFKNFFVQNAMATNVAKLTEEVAKLTGTATGEGGTGLSGLSTILGKVTGEAETFSMVLPDMVKVFQGSSPLAGGLTAITGLLTALLGGFKMMEEGFSLAGEAAVVFGGVLTTIGLILAGVAAWPAVIVGAIVVFIANLGAFGDDLLNWVVTTAGEITEKIGEFFHNLGFYVGALIHEALEALFNLLKEGLEYISKPENWLEFGLNILKGILAIFLLPFRLLEWIGTAIANLLSGFIEGLCTGFDMHSPSKVMEPYGENILKGILEGILSVISSIGSWITSKIVDPIKKKFSEGFNSENFQKFGDAAMKGLKTGISKVSEVISKASQAVSDIKKKFSDGLKSNSLVSIGTNLINGLKSGLTSALSSALSTVSEICGKITSKAKQAFQIHSPSKVFENIGEMLDAGLIEGVENGVDDVDESFEDIIPSTKILDSFYDRFIEMITALTSNVTTMFDEMFLHIEESMKNLETMMAMSNLYNSLDKIPDMKLPAIASGQTLPANKEFKQSSTELDLSKLPGIIKNAVIEAITDTADLQTDDGDTIIEIDGREIFRVVRNENSQYKKQHGASAFA